MIVEMLGPPGVGKTTFACALTGFLRERGHAVDPVMSYRPAEQAPSGPRCKHPAEVPAIAAVRRLVRPVTEMVATAGRLFGQSPDARLTAELLRLLPPRSVLWSVRLRQYLFRLCRSWQLAAASRQIVLFDQAFVQALCSLVLLSRTADGTRIGRAMDILPRADLLIRLDAPRDILTARLDDRQRRQGRIERLFELDLQTNLAFVEIIDELHALILARGNPVVSAGSADPHTLQAGVAQAGADILAKLEAAHPMETATATWPAAAARFWGEQAAPGHSKVAADAEQARTV
jgi:thymidylate kinase